MERNPFYASQRARDLGREKYQIGERRPSHRTDRHSSTDSTDSEVQTSRQGIYSSRRPLSWNTFSGCRFQAGLSSSHFAGLLSYPSSHSLLQFPTAYLECPRYRACARETSRLPGCFMSRVSPPAKRAPPRDSTGDAKAETAQHTAWKRRMPETRQ